LYFLISRTFRIEFRDIKMDRADKSVARGAIRWFLIIFGATLIGSLLVNAVSLHLYYPRLHAGPAVIDHSPAIPQKWEFSTVGAISSALALGVDGTLYAASEDGFVYSIGPSGNLQWKFDAGSVVAAPVLGPDGTIYVTNEDQRILAINPAGAQVWAAGGGPYGDNQMGWVAAAVDQNRLYTPWRGQLHGIRLTDGSFDWVTGFGFQKGGSISILPDGLIVYPAFGRLDGVDSTGRTQWEFPMMNPPLTTDMIARGRIPVGNFGLDSAIAVGDDSTLYACGGDSRLVALTGDGHFKWEFKTKTHSRNRATPVIAVDGTVYFASGDATLYALNPDGSQKWAYETGGGPISATPILSEDGSIYVVTGSELIVVSPEGELLAHALVGGGIESSPTIAPDGTVYVAWRTGKISAFAGTHGGLMNSSWPKFQATLSNSGRSHPL
jgi:outer membrane protein assembly factor BamB